MNRVMCLKSYYKYLVNIHALFIQIEACPYAHNRYSVSMNNILHKSGIVFVSERIQHKLLYLS